MPGPLTRYFAWIPRSFDEYTTTSTYAGPRRDESRLPRIGGLSAPQGACARCRAGLRGDRSAAGLRVQGPRPPRDCFAPKSVARPAAPRRRELLAASARPVAPSMSCEFLRRTLTGVRAHRPPESDRKRGHHGAPCDECRISDRASREDGGARDWQRAQRSMNPCSSSSAVAAAVPMADISTPVAMNRSTR